MVNVTTSTRAPDLAAAVVQECKKYEMKPLCDNPRYCEWDPDALYVGQSSYFSKPEDRLNAALVPHGFSSVRGAWNGLCGYTGVNMTDRVLCNGCSGRQRVLEKLSKEACIRPYETVSSAFTLQQCQDACVKKDCAYFSRPSSASNTTKAKCDISLAGAPQGTCKDTVYQNKCSSRVHSWQSVSASGHEFMCGGHVGTCLKCPIGHFANATGRFGCLPCPLGSFSETVGATSASACRLCPAGKVDDDRDPATACKACPVGRYTSKLGEIQTCSGICSKGTFAPEASEKCAVCGIGEYDHDSDARTGCLQCPRGTFNNETGRVDCHKCAVGTYSNAIKATSDATCTICSAGTVDSDRDPATVCAACPAGRFIATTGATDCSGGCAEGTFAPEGSMTCFMCGVGQFDHDRDASTECARCPTGRFVNTVGRVNCSSCPAGTSTTRMTMRPGLFFEAFPYDIANLKQWHDRKDNGVLDPVLGIIKHTVVPVLSHSAVSTKFSYGDEWTVTNDVAHCTTGRQWTRLIGTNPFGAYLDGVCPLLPTNWSSSVGVEACKQLCSSDNDCLGFTFQANQGVKARPKCCFHTGESFAKPIESCELESCKGRSCYEKSMRQLGASYSLSLTIDAVDD